MINKCGETWCCCDKCPVQSGDEVTFATREWLADHPEVTYRPIQVDR